MIKEDGGEKSAKWGAMGSPWKEGGEPEYGCGYGRGEKEVAGPGGEGPLQGALNPPRQSSSGQLNGEAQRSSLALAPQEVMIETKIKFCVFMILIL